MPDIKKLVEKDKIVAEGFKYRRRFFNLIGTSILAMVFIFALTSILIIRLIPIAILFVALFYLFKFKSWEKTNKEYIKNLGFTVG